MHFNYFKCRRRNVIVPPGERNWTTCAGRRLKQMTSDPDMPTFQNEKEGSIFSKARRAEAWGSKGQKLRPKGPKGVAFLGRGWRSPSHQLGGLGEHCKLSQRDLGPSPGHQTAFAIFQVFRMASAMFTHTHTHTRLTALFPGLPGWAGTRKVKPIWILLKQETVSGSGISWAICKSAPRSRQITVPAPYHSFFTGRMPFLPPNQQCQSTVNGSHF